ncbi:hypothetical protein HBB16_17670 [Pseudonocardia sp. MCCB 268]|nr:hypothetical protein [Pseudonocardia cytotoxica]
MSFFDAFYVARATPRRRSGSVSCRAVHRRPAAVGHDLDLPHRRRLGVPPSGTLLSLLQDRAFRDAVALHRFTRRVRRLRGAVAELWGTTARGNCSAGCSATSAGGSS